MSATSGRYMKSVLIGNQEKVKLGHVVLRPTVSDKALDVAIPGQCSHGKGVHRCSKAVEDARRDLKTLPLVDFRSVTRLFFSLTTLLPLRVRLQSKFIDLSAGLTGFGMF